jgi:hypothetical protein
MADLFGVRIAAASIGDYASDNIDMNGGDAHLCPCVVGS